MPIKHIKIYVLTLDRVYRCYIIFDAIVIGLGRGGNKGDIWIGRDGAIRLADRMGPTGEGRPVVTKDGNGGEGERK